MKNTTVNILGTEYEILRQNYKENPKLKDNLGICEQYSKQIVVDTFEDAKEDVMCVDNLPELEKKVLRHEVIHAYLGESGLRSCSEWAENEEMIDWFACQAPKLFKTFSELGIF